MMPEALEGTNEKKSRANSILFIDASNDFEKVKTQNVLLPEHIEKIIGTYRSYNNGALSEAEVDKYSYVATLDEVRDNDYNLNIPRYVDTFEEEELVDLGAVKEAIVGLRKELIKIEDKMDMYLEELELG